MATIVQWVHLIAAVLVLGGIGFLQLILIPSLSVLEAEQREALSRALANRVRWVTWSGIILLLVSGIYNTGFYYREVPWGPIWELLTMKITFSLVLFVIVLGLTAPFRLFGPMRVRRRQWLLVASILGVVVVLISAYLRRG